MQVLHSRLPHISRYYGSRPVMRILFPNFSHLQLCRSRPAGATTPPTKSPLRRRMPPPPLIPRLPSGHLAGGNRLIGRRLDGERLVSRSLVSQFISTNQGRFLTSNCTFGMVSPVPGIMFYYMLSYFQLPYIPGVTVGVQEAWLEWLIGWDGSSDEEG
jgi:hypothetical protein